MRIGIYGYAAVSERMVVKISIEVILKRRQLLTISMSGTWK